MRLSLTRALALTWAPLAFFVFSGCTDVPRHVEAPPSHDDFGSDLETPPITEESVSETEMLQLRAQFEGTMGAVMPVGHFEWGPAAGAKAAFEAAKNVYWGIGFDWSHQTVSEGISSLSQPDLKQVDPDQWYADMDRYNIFGSLDYDMPITRNCIGKDMPLFLRLGASMGMSIVQGSADPVISRSGYTILPSYAFLFRPGIGLRWQVHKHIVLTFLTGYDLLYPQQTDVRGPDGKTQTLSGDISFSTFFVRGGFVIEF